MILSATTIDFKNLEAYVTSLADFHHWFLHTLTGLEWVGSGKRAEIYPPSPWGSRHPYGAAQLYPERHSL